jgi:hypothetical protein
MYWAYELAVWLGGPFDVTALRVAGFVSAALVVVASWAAARAVGAPRGAGIAALLVTMSLTALWHPFDGLAWNAELIALPFALFAVVAVARSARTPGRGSYAWIAAAGGLSVAAALAKQNFIVHGAVAFAWAVLADLPGRRSTRAAAFVAGSVAVAGAAVAPYAARGALGAFWYCFARYGREVYLAPIGARDVISVFVHYFLAEGHILVLAVAAWLLRARPGPDSTRAARIPLLANGAVAVVSCVFTGRDFGHYFLEYDVFAWVALAVSLEGIRVGRALAAPAALLPVALAGLTLALQNAHRPEREGLQGAFPPEAHDPRREPIGAWVRNHTGPDDEILVWGLRGDVYTSAQRWPASRFVYSLFPSGVVPWYEEPIEAQMARVVPHSHEQLLGDLEASRAPIIVDAGRSLLGRYMSDYGDLRAYLDAKYSVVAEIDGATIYRRRER